VALIPVVPIVIVELIATAVYIAGLLSLTWVFWSRLEGRSLWELGLKSDKKFRRFGTGFLVGNLVFAACIVIRLVWGLILFDSLRMDTAVATSLLSRFLYFIGTGFCEEIAFRGYVFQTVGERRSIWLALSATAALFWLVHVPAAGFDLGYFALNILATVLTVVMRLVTGSLWMSIGWHVGLDWAVGAVFGLTGTVGLILVKSSEALIANQHGEVTLHTSVYFFVIFASVIAVILWSKLTAPHMNWGKRLGTDQDSHESSTR
jgi:membrane protease YdiL (CAAX protease family)